MRINNIEYIKCPKIKTVDGTKYIKKSIIHEKEIQEDIKHRLENSDNGIDWAEVILNICVFGFLIIFSYGFYKLFALVMGLMK